MSSCDCECLERCYSSAFRWLASVFIALFLFSFSTSLLISWCRSRLSALTFLSFLFFFWSGKAWRYFGGLYLTCTVLKVSVTFLISLCRVVSCLFLGGFYDLKASRKKRHKTLSRMKEEMCYSEGGRRKTPSRRHWFSLPLREVKNKKLFCLTLWSHRFLIAQDIKVCVFLWTCSTQHPWSFQGQPSPKEMI